MASRIHRWNIRNGSFSDDSQIRVEYREAERAYHCSRCDKIQHSPNLCIHVIAVLTRRMTVTELASVEAN